MHRITEFFVGLLFGLGLLLSGMTDPAKVLGFLDLFGIWDPSLAFVMGGAIAVGFFAFALARKRTTNFMGGAQRASSDQESARKSTTQSRTGRTSSAAQGRQSQAT